jgi:transcriptional regulator with XRE-family HTH domain
MKTGELNIITGHNIRRLRKMHEYTQEELANRIKAKTSHISEMENGKRGIGEKIIVRLCNVFEVEPYEFYVNHNSPIPLTPLEYDALHMIKQAQQMKAEHVINELCEFARYRLDMVKKELRVKKTKGTKRRKSRSSPRASFKPAR